MGCSCPPHRLCRKTAPSRRFPGGESRPPWSLNSSRFAIPIALPFASPRRHPLNRPFNPRLSPAPDSGQTCTPSRYSVCRSVPSSGSVRRRPMPWTGASSSCRGTATLASACPPRERPLHGSAADDHRGGRVLGARRYRGRPSPEKPRGPKTSYDIYGLKLGEGEGPPAIWQIVQNGIQPSWSPDGQRLFRLQPRWQSRVVPRRHRRWKPAQPDRHEGYGARLSWSPDGRRIAFECYRVGNREICIIDIASGEVVRGHRSPRPGRAAGMVSRRHGDRLHVGPGRKGQYLPHGRRRLRLALFDPVQPAGLRRPGLVVPRGRMARASYRL